MPRPPGESERFAAAVYRRLIFFHLIEQSGLGFCLASVIAIGVQLLAVWQAMPTLPVISVCALLGVVFAIALVILRWPSRWSAVLEADRQLGFDDLLSSALSPGALAEDSFGLTVCAMADVRCRLHRPGDVFVRRLGAHAWSGIATVIAISCTLCMVPTGLQQSRAVDENAVLLNGSDLQTGRSVPPLNTPQSETRWDQDSSPHSDPSITETFRAGGHAGMNTLRAGGGGAGSAQSKSDALPFKLTQTSPGNSNKSGEVAGGGAGQGKGQQTNRNAIGIQNGSDTKDAPSSNLQPGSDPEQKSPGTFSPENAAVPAEDADLIRDFFKSR